MLIILRLMTSASTLFIFQNNEDQDFFIQHRILAREQAVLIRGGSGVDLARFRFRSEIEKKTDVIRFIFTGRMIRAKGVLVIAEAARLLREKYHEKISFIFCGDIDRNPSRLTKSQIESFCDSTYLQWLGYQKNIQDILEECHVMLFPSYYMEGLPKSVIEAEAAGLPVITTDSVGCRDTVINGWNGFLIPQKSAAVLAEKIVRMIGHPDERRQMGIHARMYEEQHFSLPSVIEKHLALYDSLQ